MLILNFVPRRVTVHENVTFPWENSKFAEEGTYLPHISPQRLLRLAPPRLKSLLRAVFYMIFRLGEMVSSK